MKMGSLIFLIKILIISIDWIDFYGISAHLGLFYA